MSASPVPQPSRSWPQRGLPTIAGIPADSQPAALRRLESDELLRQLARVHAQARVNLAEVLIHIIEVQRRKLWRAAGRSSMYKYCVQVLRMSESEAFRRVRAAFLGQRFPILLEALADGRLHLTAVVHLKPYLRGDNVHALVAAASHRSRKEIELMLAERFPKPEAPTVMRALVSAMATDSSASCPDNVMKLALAPVDPTDSVKSGESMGPLRAEGGCESAQAELISAAATQLTSQIVAQLGERASSDGLPDLATETVHRAVTQALVHAVTSDPTVSEAAELRSKLTPLSPGRHCWQFTVDQESQDLMDEALTFVSPGSQAPQLVLKQALLAFVEERRKQKYAQTSRPRAQRAGEGESRTDAVTDAATEQASIHMEPRSSNHEHSANAREPERHESASPAPRTDTGAPRSRHIPAHVKRAVYARDGGRCTFMSADGTRCDERRDLQFDHRRPFACGGEATLDNTRLLCAPHNQLEAERAFGEAHVRERIQAARSKTHGGRTQ